MKLLLSAVRLNGPANRLLTGHLKPETFAFSGPLAQRLTHGGNDTAGDKKLTKFKALTHLKDYLKLTKDIGSSPAAPMALGLSGLLPFFYPPLSMISSGAFDSSLVFMHLTYGATILSFIGGLRWGYCLSASSKTPPNWLYLGYSVSPQLVGWASLLMPTTAGILTVCYQRQAMTLLNT